MSDEQAVADSLVARLAEFFPGAIAIHIPVQISVLGPRAGEEAIVLEYGTPREVLFHSALPLEFGDRLRLLNSDQSLDADAVVVGVQYQNGRKAVAARFVHEPRNWIIKP